ncbi:MAG: FHA domain-containing protein [Anaerolineae bacterium]|nr:FHA domain-containing protein [Anaerolineae bacterium]
MSDFSGKFIQTALLQNVDIPQQRYVLKAPFVSIGRAAAGDNDIPIPTSDSNVSRTHASLIYDDGVWMLEDHSLNGTFVNGVRHNNRRVVLHDGDYVRIGKSFHVIFKDLEMTGIDEHSTSNFLPVPDTNGDIDGPPQKGLWVGEDGSVYRNGSMITHLITKNEFRILKYLMAHVDVDLTLEQVCRTIMGGSENIGAMSKMLAEMQTKIEFDPKTPKYLMLAGNAVRFCPSGLK